MCAAEVARRRGPGDLGSRAVPHRAVGRHGREPQAVRGGRRAADKKANEYGIASLDGPADPALPMVRHADHRQHRSRPTRPRGGCSCTAATSSLAARSQRRAESRGPSGPHGRRGDLPADASVRDRHRRQVRADSPAKARPHRCSGTSVGAAGATGIVHPDYAKCDITTTHPATGRAPRGHRAARRPAASARPHHPGRATPHHRCAGHRRRAVRGRSRDALVVGHTRRQACAAGDRCLHCHRSQRPRAGARHSTGGRWRSFRRRCSTSPTPTSPARCRSTARTPGVGTSGLAHRACACRAPRSGWRRCYCRGAVAASTGRASPPTPT